MNDAGAKASIGKRAVHELKEFLIIAAYFYVCFTALAYLKAAILEAEGIVFAPFGFAAVKALICAKFLSIGIPSRRTVQETSSHLAHVAQVIRLPRFADRVDRSGRTDRRLLAPSHVRRLHGRNWRRHASSGDCDVDHLAADLDSFLCLSLACRGCRPTRAVSSLLRTTPKA